MTTDGTPACVADCVVPAPPWWTTARQRGKIRWCGAIGTNSTPASWHWMIARQPARAAASVISASTRVWASISRGIQLPSVR
jgi:hypothetical protein